MVLEVATFESTPEHADSFAQAYASAKQYLAATPGFRSVRLVRGIETPTRFVLMVEWDSVEAHLVDFRESERFGQWRAAIGPYFTAVHMEHYADV